MKSSSLHQARTAGVRSVSRPSPGGEERPCANRNLNRAPRAYDKTFAKRSHREAALADRRNLGARLKVAGEHVKTGVFDLISWKSDHCNTSAC
jgi:hypothetical protein